ncbi:hypothetical protein HZS_6081 [Henneguya salminicola]|nr:hypothetical protein HZS_6081 [Henneguya salminicola]
MLETTASMGPNIGYARVIQARFFQLADKKNQITVKGQHTCNVNKAIGTRDLSDQIEKFLCNEALNFSPFPQKIYGGLISFAGHLGSDARERYSWMPLFELLRLSLGNALSCLH